jgi:hypothetical protein
VTENFLGYNITYCILLAKLPARFFKQRSFINKKHFLINIFNQMIKFST